MTGTRERHFWRAGCVLLGTLLANVAQAQAFVSPTALAQRGKMRLGGGFASTATEYERSNHNNSTEIKRTALFADVAYGVAQSVDVFGQFALITKTEVENIDDNGDGMGLGLGLRAQAYQRGPMRLGVLAHYAYANESVEAGGAKTKLKMAELRGGPSLSYALSDQFIPYVSLMLTLMEDNEATTKTAGRSSTVDIERDSQFTLALGGDIPLHAVAIHFGIVLIGEQSFMLGVHGNL